MGKILNTKTTTKWLSDNAIIAADYTKIGRTALTRIAPLSTAESLVTNKKANRDELNTIAASGLRIITV